MRGRDVVVLERNEAIGMETSARNSEVIHAGIYYPTGSHKAALCVEGKHRLYAYCAEHGVSTRRCGKLIVASDDAQIDGLRAIRAQGLANGAGELAWLDAKSAGELEPNVRCVAAVYSETTGIIDSHAYMLALQGDLEAHRGTVATHTTVRALNVAGNTLRVCTDDLELLADHVVNAAGLEAPGIARQAGCDVHAFYARGRYYTYTGTSPFNRLVYPVPEPGGLGVHVTLDLGGGARFGPDVEWIDDIDYGFDESALPRFAEAIRGYYPDLDDRRLQPGYTGIRPKISGPGEPAADFRIDGPEQHGIAGLVHLLGIESPGLTASLAIGERVAEALAC